MAARAPSQSRTDLPPQDRFTVVGARRPVRFTDRETEPSRRHSANLWPGVVVHLRHTVIDASAGSTEHEEIAGVEVYVDERRRSAVDAGDAEQAGVPNADRHDRRWRRFLSV